MATVYRKIKVRRDTAANLAAVVPTQGEPCYATDTGKFVIGDGSTAFASLPAYATAGAVTSSGLTMTSARILGRTTASTGAIEELTSVPATLGGTAQTSWTTGDMLYASATDTLTKRAIGSTGQVLTVSGGVPTWATPAFVNPMTTAGDIIIGGTAGAANRLAAGTNGYVLTMVSGVPAWAAGGGGGGSGTVSTGAAGKLAYYASSGTTVDDFDGTTQVSIGTPSSTAADGALAFYSDTEANASMALRGGNVNPNIYLSRSRGTIASPTAVQSGDTLGRIMAGGYSGSAWNQIYGGIKFVATENWSAGALGTKVVFMSTIAGGTDRQDIIEITATTSYAQITGSKPVMVSSTNEGFRVNSSNSTLAYVSLTFAGTQKGTIGVGGTAGDWITGSAVDDLSIRSHASKSINFSTDNGSTLHGRFVASTGQFALNANITASSTTTGTLVVTGGMGVSGKIYAGNNVEAEGSFNLNKSGSGKTFLAISTGTDSIITGSTTDEFCIRSVTSSSMLFSVDNGGSIALKIVASTGQVTMPKNITSSSTTTGTLVVTGGVGISGALNVTSIGVYRLTGAIRDSNGNDLLTPSATSSAVNSIIIANGATGNAAYLRATGSDTDVTLELQPQAAGYVRFAHPTQTAKVRFNVNGNAPHSSWLNGTTVKTLMGLALGTDSIITGSVTDDWCFRQDANKGFLFSTNASATIDFAVLANSGGLKFITPGGGVSDAWKFGNASSTSPTSPNRTVQISVNGVTIYLHGKTTND